MSNVKMQIKSEVRVTRSGLIDYLRSQGIDAPDDCYVSVEVYGEAVSAVVTDENAILCTWTVDK